MRTRIFWAVAVLLALAMETAVLAVPTETQPGAQPPAKAKGAPPAHSTLKLPPIGSLPPPEYMPELARAALRRRMERHGNDMVELLLAVTLLQHDVARKAAERIAAEPAIARPEVGGEESLNAVLPERFFVLQGELRRRAQEVSTAAAKADDKALSSAFARLSETCVQCHSIYLHPQEK